MSRRQPAYHLRDPLLAWILGIAASVVAAAFAGIEPSALYVFGVILPVQAGVTVAAVAWMARRRGRGSLAAGLGLRFRLSDAAGLLLGVALQVAIGLLFTPVAERLGMREPPQAVARLMADVTTAWGVAVVLVSVGLLGPLAEEVLFRGLLLRALRERMSDRAAIWLSAALFGVVHLLDPGAAVAVPVFVVLGVVLATLAVRDGRLGRAFFTHAGVNLTATLAALWLGRA